MQSLSEEISDMTDYKHMRFQRSLREVDRAAYSTSNNTLRWPRELKHRDRDDFAEGGDCFIGIFCAVGLTILIVTAIVAWF